MSENIWKEVSYIFFPSLLNDTIPYASYMHYMVLIMTVRV